MGGFNYVGMGQLKCVCERKGRRKIYSEIKEFMEWENFGTHALQYMFLCF
jgi:hypothetical protein